MVTEKMKKLQAAKIALAKLEAAASKAHADLSGLPGEYGFQSLGNFIYALRAASGSASTGGRGKKISSGVTTPSRKRAKITPEMKQEVKLLVKEGKTGGFIAKAVGISLPSVQNIKKELGLTYGRK